LHKAEEESVEPENPFRPVARRGGKKKGKERERKKERDIALDSRAYLGKVTKNQMTAAETKCQFND
jgi:hypothetical protein